MDESTPTHVDVHAIEIGAGAADVWNALLCTLDESFSGVGATKYARIVRCAPLRASGPRPLGTSSTIPGFEVVAAEPPTHMLLAGRHRFSTYELELDIEPLDTMRSELTAVTRATFPGVGGALYRTLVIRSGFHELAVRRLLNAVRRATDDERLVDGTRR